MYSTAEKITLFATLCVPIRLLIAYLPLNPWISREYVAGILLTIGLALLFKSQLSKSPVYTFFGSKRYWSSITHGFIYVLASTVTLFSPSYASYMLLIDVFYGIVTVVRHYYIQ
jgi:uncharacterized membrane protein HdeD (DUF308 family)